MSAKKRPAPASRSRKLFNRPDALLVDEGSLPGQPAPPPLSFEGMIPGEDPNDRTSPDLPPVRAGAGGLAEEEGEILEAGEEDEDDEIVQATFQRPARRFEEPGPTRIVARVTHRQREDDELVVPADLVETVREGAALDLSDDAPVVGEASAEWEDESDARSVSDPQITVAAVSVAAPPQPGTTLLQARTLPPAETLADPAEATEATRRRPVEPEAPTERVGRQESLPTQVMAALPAHGFPALADADDLDIDEPPITVRAVRPSTDHVVDSPRAAPRVDTPKPKPVPPPIAATPAPKAAASGPKAVTPPSKAVAPTPKAVAAPPKAVAPTPTEVQRGVVPLKQARGQGSNRLGLVAAATILLLVAVAAVAFVGVPTWNEQAATVATAPTPEPAPAPRVSVATPPEPKPVETPAAPVTASPTPVAVATPPAAVPATPAPAATPAPSTTTVAAAATTPAPVTPRTPASSTTRSQENAATLADSTPPATTSKTPATQEVAKGLIQIVSDENCLIIVDGRQRGYTPSLGPIELPAGMHVVRGVVPGKGFSRTVEVRVDAGLLRQVELRFNN